MSIRGKTNSGKLFLGRKESRGKKIERGECEERKMEERKEDSVNILYAKN